MRRVNMPRAALVQLQRAGIYARTEVTAVHQEAARRFVLRGLESGGAVEGFGRYVTFTDEGGKPLAYICPIESLAVNGLHAVVVAPVLVRVVMLRAGHTYDLLISRHEAVANGKRPAIESKVLFQGEHGYLRFDLAGADKQKRGAVTPRFWSRAGEPLPVPRAFVPVVLELTAAVNCVACSHAHFLRAAPANELESEGVEMIAAGRSSG
ncbi:MAG: hypothetical protein ACYDDI_11435 [Candidatus Acidiferrales bacterium]